MAEIKKDALAVKSWSVKYDEAVEGVSKDRDAPGPSTTYGLSTEASAHHSKSRVASTQVFPTPYADISGATVDRRVRKSLPRGRQVERTKNQVNVPIPSICCDADDAASNSSTAQSYRAATSNGTTSMLCFLRHSIIAWPKPDQ